MERLPHVGTTPNNYLILKLKESLEGGFMSAAVIFWIVGGVVALTVGTVVNVIIENKKEQKALDGQTLSEEFGKIINKHQLILNECVLKLHPIKDRPIELESFLYSSYVCLYLLRREFFILNDMEVNDSHLESIIEAWAKTINIETETLKIEITEYYQDYMKKDLIKAKFIKIK